MAQSVRRATPVDFTGNGWWRAAQLTGMIATVALLVGLVLWPEPTLKVLWNLVVPLVPASLLITPAIWRGVCPLATLNMVAADSIDRPVPSRRWMATAGAAGIVLF